MSATTSTDIPAPTYRQYSLDNIITYSPSSSLISHNWQGARDVLEYLLLNPHERDALQREANNRSPYEPKTFYVQGYFLRRRLAITAHENDRRLVAAILELLEKPALEARIRPPSRRGKPIHFAGKPRQSNAQKGAEARK